jgi:hypothetical protein
LDNPKFRDFAILHNNPVKSGETFSIKKLRVGDKITICNIYGQIIQEQIIASEDLIKFS